MKKRIVALVMAGVMAASLTACGGSDTGATTAAATEAAKTEAAGTEESKTADAQPAGSVTADAFKPSKDFNIRVPFAAGGSADTISRIVAQGLSQTYGNSAVINNLTGANGAIAAADLDSAIRILRPIWMIISLSAVWYLKIRFCL